MRILMNPTATRSEKYATRSLRGTRPITRKVGWVFTDFDLLTQQSARKAAGRDSMLMRCRSGKKRTRTPEVDPIVKLLFEARHDATSGVGVITELKPRKGPLYPLREPALIRYLPHQAGFQI